MPDRGGGVVGRLAITATEKEPCRDSHSQYNEQSV